MLISRRRTFQNKRVANAKTMWQECAWNKQEITRRPIYL